MEAMTREQIEAEIRGLDQLMREKDYIGTKIAMGRWRNTLRRSLNLTEWPPGKMSSMPC